MQATVSGENPFKVLKETFTLGPSAQGFTLAYSTSKDGTFTEYEEATPAGEVLIVNGVTPYSWFKLVGNTGEVEIIL